MSTSRHVVEKVRILPTFFCFSKLFFVYEKQTMFMHKVPNESTTTTSCDTFNTCWEGYRSVESLTVCDGHSIIRCAMRGRSGHMTVGRNHHKRVPIFCWIEHPFEMTITTVDGNTIREWHAFCKPTEHWGGRLNDPLFVSAFSRQHNHFSPGPRDVRPYIRVRRIEDQPRLGVQRIDDDESVYLLNGDQVTQPRFNPWHGLADLLNLFIVKRLLTTPPMDDVSNSSRWMDKMSLHPMSGCDGMSKGQGNDAIWRVMVSGRIFPCAKKGALKPHVSSRTTVRRIGAAVLSPQPWRSPIWTIPNKRFYRCPHQSSILSDLRRQIVPHLDSGATSVNMLLARHMQKGHIRVFDSSPSNSAQYRITYFIRRSPSHVDVDSTRTCRRCLWNVEHLCRVIANALPPGNRVVLANPGDLSFSEQYSLFRHADLLIGTHGSAFAWGVFLTPSQSVLELPLPGSPGLNDWMFAAVGARTACVQACMPNAQARGSRGCSKSGGDADITLVVQSVVDLVHETSTSNMRPIMWHQLGWKTDSMYGKGQTSLI